jgi:hypothetical protein
MDKLLVFPPFGEGKYRIVQVIYHPKADGASVVVDLVNYSLSVWDELRQAAAYGRDGCRVGAAVLSAEGNLLLSWGFDEDGRAEYQSRVGALVFRPGVDHWGGKGLVG